MVFEIERKFLVKGRFRNETLNGTRIIQGYLSSAPGRTVRIRVSGDRGFITIKGGASHSGMTRFEWEKEIPLEEAKMLFELCEPGIIDKTRYKVIYENHVFEVDEFHHENEGLIIAEIELVAENEEFMKPDWLGKEVTGESRYYNSMLVKYPFTKW